jgi:DNA topoisomerase-3
LDVYVYDKWAGNFLPQFQVGERFVPDVLDVKEGRTSQPNLLTEADLVSLMDKNGIGQFAWNGQGEAEVADVICLTSQARTPPSRSTSTPSSNESTL